jgi:hypothetical protein
MKRSLLICRLLPVIALALFFSGCFKDKLTKTYTILRPVYQSKAEVLADIKSNTPQSLKTPGKIFMLGSYLFVNEVNKGVHIIDNNDAGNPRSVAFISIPGNLDIAVKGNMLYADMFTDLVVVDISDPLNAKLLKNIPGIFPERNYGSTIFNDTSLIIVDWISKDTVVNARDEQNGPACINCMIALASDFGLLKAASPVPGVAGSMARFSIVNNYLYAVNSAVLGVFDLQVPSEPVSKGYFYVGRNIETIYPFEGKLFIGSGSGMFIYNIDDPAAPGMEGSFSHARSCDPIIADNKYAYVTLRTGTACMGTSDQLDILDVSDVLNPRLVKTYLLKNPHGLAKDGELLFICDGIDGLKIYDVTDVLSLDMIKNIKNVDAYDVIAWNGKLLMVAADGIYQYDYSDRGNIHLLSTLRTTSK